MGVPSFYRWLVNKYPEIVCDATEKSGLEFDHLYLDMNAIIHPCFHSDDNMMNPPTTFKDVFENINKYIDNLFDIVRPSKLLFMAIDGVAPRAKMNQQRARRFKTAKDIDHFEEVEQKFRKQFEKQGKKVLPRMETEVSDSNIITPGTEFMDLLSKHLQFQIKRKMNDDPHWQKIKVILSDSNVPGEGEHKIMSFIRAQRCTKGYDPNTRHCLYGLDADLIMLALATHEVHFVILREDVLNHQETGSSVVSDLEQSPSGCGGQFKMIEKSPEEPKANPDVFKPVKKMPFQFLKIWVLREYIEIDLHVNNPPENVKIDLEHLIDDFIFICLFNGNDFLPHMPTLEIHEGSIDLLIHVYKKEFTNLGGYLIDVQNIEDKKNAYIKLKRVEKFILSVGNYEEVIFRKRTEIKEKKMRRVLQEQLNDGEGDELEDDLEFYSGKESDDAFASADSSEVLKNTEELKQKVKDYIRSQSDTFKSGISSDKVKLASPGFKERYYELKLSATSRGEKETMREKMVQAYTEGLLWVLKYYFSGVPSWNWFYPFHYGPFASDLRGLAQLKVQFEKGFPLKPYDQLLAVLPPKSAHTLPDAYQKLMVDKDSAIADFYPTDFLMDAEGKRFMWQAICQLPFIDEQRLLAETEKLEKELKENEKAMNAKAFDRLFIWGSSSFGEWINKVSTSHCSGNQNDAVAIDSVKSGLNGILHFCEEDDTDNLSSVLCLRYELPEGREHHHHHHHHLLPGVVIPEKTVTHVTPTELWHESRGRGHIHICRAPILLNNKEADTDYARCGFGRGRGSRGNHFYAAESLESNFSLPGYYPDPARDLNLSFGRQCSVNGPDHWGNTNRWGSTSNLNGVAIFKDAGRGWGRDRGRGSVDNSNTNLPAGQLYHYHSNYTGSTRSTGSSFDGATIRASSSPGSRPDYNASRTNTVWMQHGSRPDYNASRTNTVWMQHGSRPDYNASRTNTVWMQHGSRPDYNASSTNTVWMQHGSRPDNNASRTNTVWMQHGSRPDYNASRTSTVWMQHGSRPDYNSSGTNTAWMQQSRPMSSSFNGQQSRNGRGQHGFKTNSSSWDGRNNHQ